MGLVLKAFLKILKYDPVVVFCVSFEIFIHSIVKYGNTVVFSFTLVNSAVDFQI